MSFRNISVYLPVVILWLVYVALTFLAPVTAATAQLGITPVGLAIIRITVALPYLLAWIAGGYCVLTLLASVHALPEKEDRLAFKHIAIGVLVLVGGLALSSLFGSARSYLIHNADAVRSLTVLTNYVHVLAPLLGFAFIFSAGGHLRRAGTTADLPWGWMATGVMALMVFVVLYFWLIFTNPNRQVSTEPDVAATYYLSDPLIVATIVLPFLVATTLGFFSVFRIARYSRGVTGYVNKRSASFLVNGLLLVIAGSLLLQALLSLGSSRLLHLGLGPLLLVIYVFIALQTLGFIFLALGAEKLSALERVMKKYGARSEIV